MQIEWMKTKKKEEKYVSLLGNTQRQNIYTNVEKQQITKILQHYFI